jgi:hypothetical protein
MFFLELLRSLRLKQFNFFWKLKYAYIYHICSVVRAFKKTCAICLSRSPHRKEDGNCIESVKPVLAEIVNARG